MTYNGSSLPVSDHTRAVCGPTLRTHTRRPIQVYGQQIQLRKKVSSCLSFKLEHHKTQINLIFRDFAYDGSVNDMARYKLNRILEKVPDKGDFDLRNVLDSVYFFS